MAIPAFHHFFHPVLVLATKGPIERRTATEKIIKQYKFTPEEINHRLPSGSQTIRNRVGWAMTFLTKAGLIGKVAPKTYQATPAGHEFLKSHPTEIARGELNKIPGFNKAWENGRARRKARIIKTENEKSASEETISLSNSTPDEIIDREVETLRGILCDRLLKAILDQTPEFFEKLVLDVLIAMGYGGSKEAAAAHLGKSGDEGIDGRINQDALGLDQIMVQAKRYQPDNIIGRPAVQAFIGSLAGQGVSKGIFITTSSFADTAKEFVLRGSSTKIVLVDGEMLIDFMIRHRIGVHVARTCEIYELDQNYFDEGE